MSQFIEYGLLAFVLAGLGYAARVVARFVGEELILPIRDRIIGRVTEFLDRLDKTLDRIERQITGHAPPYPVLGIGTNGETHEPVSDLGPQPSCRAADDCCAGGGERRGS